eukprot:394621-Pelagomonas_calceolata.AAC.1
MAPPRGTHLRTVCAKHRRILRSGGPSCQRLGLHQQMGVCWRVSLEAIRLWLWICLSTDTDSGTWIEAALDAGEKLLSCMSTQQPGAQ